MYYIISYNEKKWANVMRDKDDLLNIIIRMRMRLMRMVGRLRMKPASSTLNPSSNPNHHNLNKPWKRQGYIIYYLIFFKQKFLFWVRFFSPLVYPSISLLKKQFLSFSSYLFPSTFFHTIPFFLFLFCSELSFHFSSPCCQGSRIFFFFYDRANKMGLVLKGRRLRKKNENKKKMF